MGSRKFNPIKGTGSLNRKTVSITKIIKKYTAIVNNIGSTGVIHCSRYNTLTRFIANIPEKIFSLNLLKYIKLGIKVQSDKNMKINGKDTPRSINMLF
jgi:hypothetical protein